MDATGSRWGLNRRGQAMGEYATLLALVVVALVVIVGLFGQATKHAWDKSASTIADDPPASGYTGAAPSSSWGSSGGVRHIPPSPPSQAGAGAVSNQESPDSAGSNAPDSVSTSTLF